MPTFNGETLLITLDSGVTSVDVDVDLYKAWKLWQLAGNMHYPQAFRTVGGDALSVSVNSGGYFFLQNQYGWRLKPPEEDINILVNGNLAPEVATLPMMVTTTGAYTVLVQGLQPITQNVDSIIDRTTEHVVNLQYLLEGLRPSHSGFGKIWYWDPYGGNDANTGTSPQEAFKTFARTHNIAGDYNHDVIVCHPGDPSGTTVTTENLSITKNYLFVRGPGRDFQISSANDALDCINITGTGVQISKLRIGDNPTNTKHAIWTSGDFVSLEHVIVNNTNKGVEIFGGARIKINGLDAQDNLSYGLKIAGGATRVSVDNSHLGDNGGDGLCIDNPGGDDVSINSGNVIHGNGGRGIYISAANTGVILHHDNHVYLNALGDINDEASDTYREDLLHLEETATAVWAKQLETLTAEEIMRITLAALAGKREGIGTATEKYMGRDGITPRITFSPEDEDGNGLPIINGAP